VLGKLADHTGVDVIYQICAFLPLIGLLAAFLPDLHEGHALQEAGDAEAAAPGSAR
jgi:FSR family fosmidomycin resistance protein-like MFS transporter